MSATKTSPSFFSSFFKSSRRQTAECALHGHPASPVPVPGVDTLSDDDLERMNGLLPWKAFTTDVHGRRIGHVAWSNKRTEAQAIPDRRILMLHQRGNL